MDKYSFASKLVLGVVTAIVVNKLTPHIESAFDTVVAQAKKTKD